MSYARRQIDLAGAGQLDASRSMAATASGKQLFDTIRARNTVVAGWLTRTAAATQRQVSGLQRRLLTRLATVLGVLGVVVVVGCGTLWATVARPLARLAANTRAVAGGNLAAQLPAAGAAEVQSLAADVRAMRDRLAADLHTTRQALHALSQTGPAVAALQSRSPSAWTSTNPRMEKRREEHRVIQQRIHPGASSSGSRATRAGSAASHPLTCSALGRNIGHPGTLSIAWRGRPSRRAPSNRRRHAEQTPLRYTRREPGFFRAK